MTGKTVVMRALGRQHRRVAAAGGRAPRAQGPSGRYLVCRTKILDRPGSLRILLGHLAEDRINIVDVEHHREGIALGVTDVEVELTLETRDRDHCVEVLESLRRRGYEVDRVR